MKLKELRKIAKDLGCKVEAAWDDAGWGYWLLKEDGLGIWDDDNFCTTLEEVEYKLAIYENEKES